MDKRRFGLIGFPLSHSFSAGYFAEKFNNENILDAQYDAFELKDINEVESIFSLENIQGINVTIPYKEAIIPYLDELSQEAKEIGAVNTVLIENHKKIGFNTDAFGFKKSLQEFILIEDYQALILGTGGASKAVQYVFKDLGIAYTLVSRNSDFLTYEEIDESIIKTHNLIVNTTPLGMSPNINHCPNIPYQYLSSNHYLLDLIYNPEKTLFLTKGEEKGAHILNGLPMLVNQAEKAWNIWNKQ